MALDPGRGRTAVPVRSSLVGVTLGLTALVAALTFGASLTHFVDTPRLYGVDWDVQLTSYGFGPDIATVGRAAARADPDIEAVAFGEGGFELEVDNTRVTALVLDRGSVAPPVVSGRAPTDRGEVVLTPKVLDRLAVAIGDEVTVRFAPGEPAPMRVVGEAVVLPPYGDPGRFGAAAWITPAAATRLAAELEADERVDFKSTMFVRLVPGADPEAVRDHLDAEMKRICARQGGVGCDRPAVGEGLSFVPVNTPTDVVNFGRVRSTPLLLGGILAALAAATLAFVLVSAVQRRQRDLAILKTLGFTRGQVTAAVLWQATTLGALALVVALPAGVMLGRFLWRLRADDLGIVFEPRVPVVLLVLVAVAVVLLANAIAALPARAAADTRPALVLRSD
jgi:predicted lysophospholipase L1 biosynthesis ABC-type transport system permease subunit